MSPEPVLAFADAAGWDAWLSAHHGSSRAVALKIGKKGAGSPSITYAQALDVALAWGWIDSRKSKHDDAYWLQRFSPRTSKSPWSRINRAKAESLIESGKMREPGMAEVKRARSDGRWERAYDSHRTSRVPPDLAAAFARNRRAALFFETIDAANRYAILYRVQTAKKDETRAARIAKFVEMLAKGKTIHPRKKRRAV